MRRKEDSTGSIVFALLIFVIFLLCNKAMASLSGLDIPKGSTIMITATKSVTIGDYDCDLDIIISELQEEILDRKYKPIERSLDIEKVLTSIEFDQLMSKSDFSEFDGVDYILFLKIIIKDDTATSYIKIVSVKTSAIVFINMENVDTEKVENSSKPSKIVKYQYVGSSELQTQMNFGAEASMSSVSGEYPSKNFGTVFDRMQLMNANVGIGLLFKSNNFIMHFMPSVGYTIISAYGIKGFQDKEVNGTNVNIDFAVILEDTYRAGWGWRNISINNQWKSQIDSFVGIGFVKIGMAYFIGEESDGISSAFIGTYVGFLFDWHFLSKVF